MSAVIREAVRCMPRPVAPRQAIKPALAAYVTVVEGILASGIDEADVPVKVAEALAPLAAVRDLLEPAQRTGDPHGYARHTLYADAEGRFTVLAIVWQPGQTSCVHGHSAWCAMAVHEGRPSVALYDYEQGYGALLRNELRCAPGDVSWVRPGLQQPHRLFNADSRVAITLHTYGRDLRRDPAAINIPV
jgi:predicted metal-dependent enzyme (double-stranded beta helix superfamily)